ncbi:RNA polymerase sigma-70 factor, ECF subfamily [Terribacillus saccharophilus]|uniref:RNA polymerase sigma-70 factor, ECF subfamily n=1 Tax=Terribacillus saccharophilus TaxID=361277 RepID=A0A075LJB9_9BACI|nr:sigma-70 family RNA polymerase sigma factor [Terribacillus goriensis]AIF66027.1 RNA polymerase sigma70 factor [Terribacillus goriensis]SEM90819.1 RNA polymerase sigma-70 factor, ECF subfamily [Terribacillus saccharophilus]
MSRNDVELYTMTQQGDKQALETLYDKYEKLIYSFSFRMTQQQEIAEEAVQEVFLKLWTKRDIYSEQKGKFSSWLLTVTRHTCIDLIRKKQRAPAPVEEKNDDKADQDAVEDIVEWKEKGEILRKAMGDLSKEQQQIIEMLYYKGYSQAELSRQLDIPLGTVKGRVRLALKHMKSKLVKEKGGV